MPLAGLPPSLYMNRHNEASGRSLNQGGPHEHRDPQAGPRLGRHGIPRQEAQDVDRREMGRGQERQDLAGRGSGDPGGRRACAGRRQGRHRPRREGGAARLRERPVVAHLAGRPQPPGVAARRSPRAARRRVLRARGARQRQAGHQCPARRRPKGASGSPARDRSRAATFGMSISAAWAATALPRSPRSSTGRAEASPTAGGQCRWP